MVEDVPAAADDTVGGGGTSIRRTIPLLLEGEEEDAEPKEVSSGLLLVIPADKALISAFGFVCKELMLLSRTPTWQSTSGEQ